MMSWPEKRCLTVEETEGKEALVRWMKVDWADNSYSRSRTVLAA